MNILNKLVLFFKLVRWPNLLIIVLIQLSLYYVLIDRMYSMAGVTGALNIYDLLILVSITVLIAAGGYIINDYFDLKTDRINKPQSIILGRGLNRRTAIVLHLVLNGIALMLGFYLAYRVGSWRLGLLFPMIIMLLWQYSVKYKRTVIWGNLSIAFMAAMVVLIIWLFEFFMLRQQPGKFVTISPYLGLITWYFVLFGAFSFLLTFIREVVKDAEDIEGDSQVGINTLPVVYGVVLSRKIALFITLMTTILMIYAVVDFIRNGLMITGVYYSCAVILPLIYLMYRISQASEKSDFHLLSTIIKVLMIAGIIGLQPLAMTIG